MTEYISTIIYICIFSTILEFILPNNKLKKYVGVLVSLLIILVLISPVINVLKNEDVVETISSAVSYVKSKIELKEYDTYSFKEKIVFSSVKEDLEKEIYTKCKKKLDSKYEISKVKIVLNSKYTVEDIDIYVKRLDDIKDAGLIIDFVSSEYELDPSVINVLKENV